MYPELVYKKKYFFGNVSYVKKAYTSTIRSIVSRFRCCLICGLVNDNINFCSIDITPLTLSILEACEKT